MSLACQDDKLVDLLKWKLTILQQREKGQGRQRNRGQGLGRWHGEGEEGAPRGTGPSYWHAGREGWKGCLIELKKIELEIEKSRGVILAL